MTNRTQIAKPPSTKAEVKERTSKLEPKELECFACLGVMAPAPATFDKEAVAAIARVSPTEATSTLKKLVNLGLLTAEKNVRFSINAVVANYARSLLS